MPKVVREIIIDAPVPLVWRHLTDREDRRRWLGGDLDVELRPGGRGTFVAPAGRRAVQVDDVDEGRSVTFTWGDDVDRSQVSIEVEREGDGSRVRVTETTDVDQRRPSDGRPPALVWQTEPDDRTSDASRRAESGQVRPDDGAGVPDEHADLGSADAAAGDPTPPVASIIPLPRRRGSQQRQPTSVAPVLGVRTRRPAA